MISSSYCCSHGLNHSLCCHSTVSHRITSPFTQSTGQSLTLHNDPFNRSYFRRIDSKDALGSLSEYSLGGIFYENHRLAYVSTLHAPSSTYITPRDCHTRAAMAKLASSSPPPLSSPLTEHLSFLPFGNDPVNPFHAPSSLSLFYRTSSPNKHVQSLPGSCLRVLVCRLHL